MFKIEKGIEIPEKKSGRKRKYPFVEMQVGESFFVPIVEGKSLQELQAMVGACANAAIGKGKVTVRIDGDGVRCWRIAE